MYSVYDCQFEFVSEDIADQFSNYVAKLGYGSYKTENNIVIVMDISNNAVHKLNKKFEKYMV